MPIQPESKIYPHVIPEAPERTGDFNTDMDAVFRWVQDTNNSLTDLNRQIVDKYNLHISGTHAHPKAWEKMRVRRPSYYNTATSSTTVTVPASTGVPIYFVINGELLEVTSDLTCDLSGGGSGGLDTHPGTAIAANTPYYLYGVKTSSVVALIASANDPETASADSTGNGPEGYTEWTYIGSMATGTGGATFRQFKASNGFILFDGDVETETLSSPEDSYVSRTWLGMPTTVKKAWVRLGCFPDSGGVGAGQIAYISGHGNTSQLLARCQVNGQVLYVFGWVSIPVAQTAHLYIDDLSISSHVSLRGWQEDPTEYK